MTAGYSGNVETNRQDRPGVDAARLWAGGVAAAVVAALAAIVGLLIARGVFNMTVLEPKGQGVWGGASTAAYAIGAAAVALLATALIHLLCLAVPAPRTFFQWIMVLVTAIGVVLPLTLTASTDAKYTTAAINLVLGLIITGVVGTMAESARTLHQSKRVVVTQTPHQADPRAQQAAPQVQQRTDQRTWSASDGRTEQLPPAYDDRQMYRQ